MSHGFAKRCNLPRIRISPRTLDGLTPTGWKINEVAWAEVDIGDHCQKRMFFYIVPRLSGCDLMLGSPWMVQEKAVLDQSERTITFKNTGLIVKQDSDLP